MSASGSMAYGAAPVEVTCSRVERGKTLNDLVHVVCRCAGPIGVLASAVTITRSPTGHTQLVPHSPADRTQRPPDLSLLYLTHADEGRLGAYGLDERTRRR